MNGGSEDMEKIKIGVSACLLGERVRYDGGHKLDRLLIDALGEDVTFVPVCPEVECGLGVPREAMHLEGDPDAPRLVTVRTGKDCTEQVVRWAQKKVREVEKERLSGFILKSRSPSCGLEVAGVCRPGCPAEKKFIGLFARTLMGHLPLLPAEDAERLHDPEARKTFLDRVLSVGRRRGCT